MSTRREGKDTGEGHVGRISIFGTGDRSNYLAVNGDVS